MSVPEAPIDPLVGALIENRWRVLERIGVDGDTEAYKIEPLKGGKPVCLRLLDARCASSRELAARFDREARTISRVDHPHCVSILGFGIHRSRPYLVTQQFAGRRLSEEIGKPQLTPARAARVAGQILEGLRHGHAHGVIHRDLSPDKIVLVGAAAAPDQVKILDFGLARILGGDDKRRAASAWLAPEQLHEGPVDQRADVHAVGLILRAMLAGQPSASASLQRVIARALAVQPEQRFADSGEMLAALEATIEGRAGLRRGAERDRGARLRSASVAALLVAVGATTWWLHARPKRALPMPVAPPLSSQRPPSPKLPAPNPGPTLATTAAPPATVTPAASMASSAVNDAQDAQTAKPAKPANPANPATKPAKPATNVADATDGARARVEALLAAGRLDEAEAALRTRLATDADRAELHVELAEVLYRRFWRRDAIAEWDRALALEPALGRDPRIATRLCTILGARWSGAGAQLIERRLGHEALPAIVACASSVMDIARLQAAAQLAERLGGAVDAQLLARRTVELTVKGGDVGRE